MDNLFGQCPENVQSIISSDASSWARGNMLCRWVEAHQRAIFLNLKLVKVSHKGSYRVLLMF